MPPITFRFGAGAGLQLSPAEKTQAGYLRMDNARVDADDIVEKRRGAVEVARTTTDDPATQLPPQETGAIWHREEELVIEASDRLYSRRECSGQGAQTLGTATSGEISDALAALDDRAAVTYDVTIPLAGSLLTTDAIIRLERADSFFDDDITLTNANAVDIDSRLDKDDPGVLKLTWDGAGVTPGSFTFPPSAANPGYYQVSSLQALAWVAVSPQSGRPNRCDVLIYNVNALVSPPRLEALQIQEPLRDVFGPPINSCVSGNASGVVVVNDPAPALTQVVSGVTGLSDGTVRALGNDVRAFFLSSSQFVFDGIDDILGVRVVAAAIGKEDVTYLSFPAAPGPATTEEFFTSGVPDPGDRIGIAFNFSEDVTSHKLGTSKHTRRRDGGSYRFDSVFSGDLVYRYGYALVAGVTSLALTRIVDGVPFERFDLVTPVAPRVDMQVTSHPDGRHVGWVIDNVEALSQFVVYADPGAFTPTLDPRPSRCGATATDGTVTAYAWAEDGPPSQVTVRWTFDFVSWTDVAISVTDAPGRPSLLALSVLDDGIPDALVLMSLLYDDPASPAYRTLLIISVDTGNPGGAVRTSEALVSVQPVALASFQAGLFPRQLLAVRGSTDEVYESDVSLYLRVSPPTITLPGGNWASRGPWTRCRLRVVTSQDWGEQVIAQTAACAVTSPATGAACFLQLVQVLAPGANAGLQVLVYSDHTETGGVATPLLLGAFTDPHAVNCGDDTVCLTYVDPADGAIYYLFWLPGEPFTFASTGLVALTPAAPIYDLAGGVNGLGVAFYGLVVVDAGGVTVQYRDKSVSGTETVPLVVDDVSAVAVWASPEPDVDDAYLLVAAVGSVAGGYGVNVTMYNVDALGVFTVVWTNSFATGTAGDVVRQVTIGGDVPAATAETALLSIEVSPAASIEWEVRTYEVNDISFLLVRTDPRAAVYGSYAMVRDQLVHWQTSIEFGQAGNKSRRSGIFGVAPRTGEYVSRFGYGDAEGFVERAFRRQVSDANRYGDLSVLGFAAETGAVTQQLTASKVSAVDVKVRPNCPAQLQRVAVSAHAGYPRGYDSATVFEQDWHELPRISDSTAVAGGNLLAGEYGFALTWEWYDSRGNRYRSSPAFETIALTANQFIQVEANALARTERRGVQLVAWQTLNNGTSYRRAGSTSATPVGLGLITLDLTGSQSVLKSAEVLDQVTGVGLPSQLGHVTDFLAEAHGRFWSRDPERGEVARFTTVSSEAVACHWPLTQVIDGPGNLTAVGEMLGRVVLWSRSTVAYTSGGPDNAGRGAYPFPAQLSLSTGATDQCTLARIPFGYAYGSTRTPHLLNGGLTSADMALAITRVYEVDGEVAQTTVYRPRTGEVVVSNGPTGRTFRYHLDSQRWASDPPRPLKDQSESKEQEYAALVADGRVLVERLTDEPSFTDGAVSYPLVVSTPWIHASKTPLHTLFDVKQLQITGEYRGPHDLILSLYIDYQTTARTWRVPAAQIAENQALGRHYLYQCGLGVGCYAARLEVSDGGEPNATTSIQAIDVTITPREAGAMVMLPEPFRFGDQ